MYTHTNTHTYTHTRARARARAHAHARTHARTHTFQGYRTKKIGQSLRQISSLCCIRVYS